MGDDHYIRTKGEHMPVGTLSRYDQHMLDKVLGEDFSRTVAADLSMGVNDYLVNVSINAASRTITLPPVGLAAGRTYTIYVSGDAGSGAASNVCTVKQKGDAVRWIGDIRMYRAGQFVTLASNGESWQRVSWRTGQPSQYGKYIYENFTVPFALSNANAGGGPRGTTGDINNLVLANGNFFNIHVKVTQTLLGPIWVNPGLNISQDLTDDDGLEYNHGVGANTPFQFTVGTDPAFFFRVRFTLADVSGTDDCCVGFRKREANQAAVDNYDEGAFLNVILGDINIETILNNAATTTTDTTNNWADGESHTLAVYVSAAGVVTY